MIKRVSEATKPAAEGIGNPRKSLLALPLGSALGALKVGDVPAQHFRRLNDSTKALGQNRIECHFSKIVKQTTDKRL